MWDLPGSGIELMSPALAGGFSTTVPPGKSIDAAFFFFKDTFIQRHDHAINSMGAKKKKSTLKPFVGMLYTFHRTETKITCYTISHNYSP